MKQLLGDTAVTIPDVSIIGVDTVGSWFSSPWINQSINQWDPGQWAGFCWNALISCRACWHDPNWALDATSLDRHGIYKPDYVIVTWFGQIFDIAMWKKWHSRVLFSHSYVILFT
jgi:hypothetical protein